jgi:hypothetical protein
LSYVQEIYKDSWHGSHGGWGEGRLGEIEKKEDVKGKEWEDKGRRGRRGVDYCRRPWKMEDVEGRVKNMSKRGHGKLEGQDGRHVRRQWKHQRFGSRGSKGWK